MNEHQMIRPLCCSKISTSWSTDRTPIPYPSVAAPHSLECLKVSLIVTNIVFAMLSLYTWDKVLVPYVTNIFLVHMVQTKGLTDTLQTNFFFLVYLRHWDMRIRQRTTSFTGQNRCKPPTCTHIRISRCLKSSISVPKKGTPLRQ